MKTQKLIFSLLAAAFIGAGPLAKAQADGHDPGGHEGHGGFAWVCFSIPLSKATRRDDRGTRITKLGRKNIIKAETLEYHLASLKDVHTPFFDGLPRIKHRGEALNELLLKIKHVSPALFVELQTKQLPIVQNPQNQSDTPDGLLTLGDGAPPEPDDSCAVIQAVNRRLDNFYWDKDIKKFFAKSPAQLDLMDLHEGLYRYAVEKLGFTNSVSVQEFIIALLNTNFSDSDLNAKMTELKLGKDLNYADYLRKVNFYLSKGKAFLEVLGEFKTQAQSRELYSLDQQYPELYERLHDYNQNYPEIAAFCKKRAVIFSPLMDAFKKSFSEEDNAFFKEQENEIYHREGPSKMQMDFENDFAVTTRKINYTLTDSGYFSVNFDGVIENLKAYLAALTVFNEDFQEDSLKAVMPPKT